MHPVSRMKNSKTEEISKSNLTDGELQLSACIPHNKTSSQFLTGSRGYDKSLKASEQHQQQVSILTPLYSNHVPHGSSTLLFTYTFIFAHGSMIKEDSFAGCLGSPKNCTSKSNAQQTSADLPLSSVTTPLQWNPKHCTKYSKHSILHCIVCSPTFFYLQRNDHHLKVSNPSLRKNSKLLQ